MKSRGGPGMTWHGEGVVLRVENTRDERSSFGKFAFAALVQFYPEQREASRAGLRHSIENAVQPYIN
jgi:hypothetical protein